MNQAITIISMPFYGPAVVVASPSQDNLGKGFMLSMGAIAMAVFFGIAFLISRSKPNAEVMKKALLVWLVGFILALLFVSYMEPKIKADKKAAEMASVGKLS